MKLPAPRGKPSSEVDSFEPKREGLCNALLKKSGHNPRGSRCKQPPRYEDGRCAVHKGRTDQAPELL